MVSTNDRSTTTRSGRMMPRWLAAAAASVTLAVALAATPTDAPEAGSAEPAVTHAGIIDSIFEVFQEFIGWRGYYDDPPREPSDGW